MASIGDNIKRLRQERHLSQEQLCAKIGMNLKSMSFYENSKRHIPADWLVPLARALGVTVDEICGYAKEPTIEDELTVRIGRAVLDALKDFDISPKTKA